MTDSFRSNPIDGGYDAITQNQNRPADAERTPHSATSKRSVLAPRRFAQAVLVTLSTLSTLSLSLALLPQQARAATSPAFDSHHTSSAVAPSFAAQADAESINVSLSGLRNTRAASFVAYALQHRIGSCLPAWPFGIEPTVPMLDKFSSACWLLQDPSLTPADVAYVLAALRTWDVLPPR